MSSCRSHGIIDGDDGQRADGVAFGLGFMKLGNFFFERAARQRYAERAFLERCGAASAGAFFQ